MTCVEKHERRERVNLLAEEAKGSHDATQKLWLEVEGLVISLCSRFVDAHPSLEFGDYFNSSYIEFLKAVNAYDINRGASFSTILTYYVRNACRSELGRAIKHGWHGGKPIKSLDAPVGEDLDPLHELICDPLSEDPFEDVSLQSVAETVLDEVNQLPNPVQKQIVRECIYLGKPLELIANELRVTKQTVSALKINAIKHLRRSPNIRTIKKELYSHYHDTICEVATSSYRRKSVKSFRSDSTSVVEAIIFSRESYDQNNKEAASLSPI